MTEHEKNVLSYVDKDEIISFMQELIRARSDYPPGDTRKAAQVCADKLRQYGVDTQVIAPPPSVKSAKNDGVDNSTMPSVIGTIKGGDGPCLLLNAHIDTVSAGELSEWECDPYAAEIKNGCIYGRGAGDDKGSVLAQVMAATIIKRANVRLKGTLIVNPVADEEANSARGAKWLRDANILKPDMAIIGEQTNNTVACAERAVLFVVVTIKGKAAHGAMPWEGNNATVHMCEFVNLVNQELLPEVQKIKHRFLPPTTLSTTKIRGGIQTNIIPETCTLDIDCRLSPGVTEDYVLNRFSELLRRLSEKGPAFEWKIDVTNSEGGIATDTDPEAPLIKELSGALNEVSGKEIPLTGYKQASDGRIFAKLGIPIAIFGPGDPSLGHSPNECVPIEQLVEAVKTLTLSVMRLLG
ncbi:MAG: M20 family metallopeptidase [Bacillota bacterium]|nr:M20 family metallopeptidase [Bacillota bacterium]